MNLDFLFFHLLCMNIIIQHHHHQVRQDEEQQINADNVTTAACSRINSNTTIKKLSNMTATAISPSPHCLCFSTVLVKHALKRCILGEQSLKTMGGGTQRVEAIERRAEIREESMRGREGETERDGSEG